MNLEASKTSVSTLGKKIQKITIFIEETDEGKDQLNKSCENVISLDKVSSESKPMDLKTWIGLYNHIFHKREKAPSASGLEAFRRVDVSRDEDSDQVGRSETHSSMDSASESEVRTAATTLIVPKPRNPLDFLAELNMKNNRADTENIDPNRMMSQPFVSKGVIGALQKPNLVSTGDSMKYLKAITSHNFSLLDSNRSGTSTEDKNSSSKMKRKPRSKFLMFCWTVFSGCLRYSYNYLLSFGLILSCRTKL